MVSRWEQLINHLDAYSHLANIFQPHFPIEVRYYLKDWFEEKQWHQLNPDNPACELMAKELFLQMQSQLSEKIAQLSSPDVFILRMNLDRSKTDMQNAYQDNPLEFLRMIQTCMQKETELLAQLQGTQGEAMDTGDAQVSAALSEHRRERARVNEDILQHLKEFQQFSQGTETQLKKTQDEQEEYIILFQANEKCGEDMLELQIHGKEMLAGMTSGAVEDGGRLLELLTQEKEMLEMKKQYEKDLEKKAHALFSLRSDLARKYSPFTEGLKLIQSKIVDEELVQWKQRQKLAGNGLLTDKRDLDMLQHWCEILVELLSGLRQQIKSLEVLQAELKISSTDNVTDSLGDLGNTVTNMLSALVTSTFIVEEQPPQVLKKESKFSATVRLLVGGKLSVHVNPPKVKATIMSEAQIRKLVNDEADAKNEMSGNILNNSRSMELQPSVGPFSAGCLSVHFKNMQLKTIRRADARRGTEAVTEEKFCILFQSDFKVGGNDLDFKVWTLSLPVVVTVHGNQECKAVATVLWDNAFSELGRWPFDLPEMVPWPKLADQLQNKFVQMTGNKLTPGNLEYLASKIFNVGPEFNYDELTVTWAQFNKDLLRDRTFTFWEWFYSILKLTKEHLKGPWADGSVIGFINKTKALESLCACVNGTFLLRFSDSECGGVSVAYITQSADNPELREIINLEPFYAKDLATKALGDRMLDLTSLTTLYPDIGKDDAFSKYYTVRQDLDKVKKKGYTPHKLVTVVQDRWQQPVLAQGR